MGSKLIKPNFNSNIKLNPYHPLMQGLHSWWMFNEGAGNVVYDQISNLDGTLTNMDPSTDWVEGPRGSVLDFDGGNDQINLGNLSIPNAKARSMTAWLNVVNNSLNQRVWASGTVDTGGNDFSIQVFNGGLRGIVGADASTQFVGSTSGINTNEWVHTGLVFDGANSKLKLYINGVIKVDESTGSANAVYTGSKPWRFGVHADGLDEELKGMMDDFRLYTRILNDEDISEIYNEPYSMVEDSKVVPMFFVAAAGGGGRIMSSLTNHGGLAGRGGIAGIGGGLAS